MILKAKRKLLFFTLFISLFSSQAHSQTKGLIFEPASGGGAAVLDPNGDGYVSQTTAGFINNDNAESEIPYVAFVFPGAEPTSDINNGPNCGFTDFVDSGTEDPALTFVDAGNNWLFRMRMGSALPNAKSYSVLVDTDGLFGPADPDYSADNPGFEIEIVLATSFGVFVYDVNTPNCSPVISYPGNTNYHKAIAHSEICGQLNYFLDFFVDFADLNTQFGITSATPVMLAIVDNMAADKSTICNPNSASDIGGVDDSCGSLSACLTQIINNQNPCSPNDLLLGLCGDKSDCPGINGPISVNDISVSGTSSEADGTSIELFINGVSAGTTTTSGGTWTITGLTLNSSDSITANALAPGESISDSDCNLNIVDAVCTPPVFTALECSAGKAFEGTGIPGAFITIYYENGLTPSNPQSGNIFTAGAPYNTIQVDGTGTWLWRCLAGGQTLSCTAGGAPCIPDGAYRITQTLPGQCESDPVWICVGGLVATETPLVSTSPITSLTTTISGTMPAPDNVVDTVTLFMYINGGLYDTTTTTVGGLWSFSGLQLNACDTINFQALRTGTTQKCISALTIDFIVEGGTSEPPVITGDYCTATTISSVSGTSVEPEGTIIQVYENGSPVGDPALVQANGTWEANVGISISPGNTITAIATSTISCESSSLPSAGVDVFQQSTNAVAITTAPVFEQSSSISGTGTDGDVITLLVDGFPVAGASAVVSGGVWTISGLQFYDLYLLGEVTAVATTPGFCESSPSAAATIICLGLDDGLNVTPDSEVICEGSFVANVQVELSENLIIYQLFLDDEITPTGSSVLGTGGTITLTSGVLTASTILKVKALKIPPGSCETFLIDNIPVTVNAVPDTTLVVSTTSPICSGNATTVDIALSEIGFDYQLRNDADDSNIGVPIAGDGGTISLPTGNLTSTTTFNVFVTGVAPSSCSNELLTIVTVTVNVCAVDTDGDGVLDATETANGTDPNDPCSYNVVDITEVITATVDCDGDGVLDATEIANGTDPNDPCSYNVVDITVAITSGADCDGDGVLDATEIANGTDPNDPCSYNVVDITVAITSGVDCDGDGVDDATENLNGSDPFDPCDPVGINTTDTDGDGVTDCEETTGIDDPSTPYVPTGTSDPNDPCDPVACGLEIPEGFTPDGDLINDLFVIPGIENYPGNELIVFNRWGNKVYEIMDYDNTWNGTMNVGIQLTSNTELPTGTYYYILDTKDETIGEKGVFQGFVYIQR